MAKIEMVMPKMGESIMEATVLCWLKEEGDIIESDDSVLEVATDKVDTEVPAIENGILEKILVKEGEVAKVGQPICIINTDGMDAGTFTEKLISMGSQEVSSAKQPTTSQLEAVPLAHNEEEILKAKDFLSPLVKNIAKKENLSTKELKKIIGTGLHGRVTKNDVLKYVTEKRSKIASQQFSKMEDLPVIAKEGEEIIKMDRMRVMIAERMIASKQIAPHVTSFVEADVSDLYDWRKKVKDDVLKNTGEKLSFTPIFVHAVSKTIQDFPMINISVVGNKIVKKSAINIGIAVALPNGNLIVPVIKNTENKSLLDLTKETNRLVKKARENQLNADDLNGGTYTISNIGTFGNILGTPIIMQPQVAILAIGAIEKKPAVIETPDGDIIGIRKKMYLSHSYDHRVIDGALGGMFVKRVAENLEKYDNFIDQKLSR